MSLPFPFTFPHLILSPFLSLLPCSLLSSFLSPLPFFPLSLPPFLVHSPVCFICLSLLSSPFRPFFPPCSQFHLSYFCFLSSSPPLILSNLPPSPLLSSFLPLIYLCNITNSAGRSREGMERLNYSFTPPSLFPPSLSTVSSILNPPPLALLFLSVIPIPLSSQISFTVNSFTSGVG